MSVSGGRKSRVACCTIDTPATTPHRIMTSEARLPPRTTNPPSTNSRRFRISTTKSLVGFQHLPYQNPHLGDKSERTLRFVKTWCQWDRNCCSPGHRPQVWGRVATNQRLAEPD